MRILIVSDDPDIVGGIPTYTTRLAKSFANLGHSVFHFQSGTYLNKYDFKFRPYIYEYQKPSEKVTYATIINSPNFLHNSHHPIHDIYSPKIEDLFISYIQKTKPDIIHVNSMVGLCSSMLSKAVKLGFPVINSFHEYWYICQQRVLLEKGTQLCNGPAPEKCYFCLRRPNPLKVRLKGLLRHTSFVEKYKKLKQSISPAPLSLHSHPPIVAGNINKAILEEHRERLKYNIGFLSKEASLNLAVSKFVKDKFMEYGVPDKKIETLYIGTNIAEIIMPKKIESQSIKNRDIVFGFIGSAGPLKGTHILVKAFTKMKMKNAKLNIYGKIHPDYLDQLKQISPDNQRIIYKGQYKYNDLTAMLNEIDVIVVPALCYDTMPQTVFEAFSAKTPVIGSNIGGIPDFVKDGKTGYLFEPGNDEMLAGKMDQIAKNPDLIVEFSNQIMPVKKMNCHSEELIEIYKSFCRK